MFSMYVDVCKTSVADAADRRSVDTSRGYTSDDTVDRAGNSSRVAQLFSPQR